jgi:hypothetical protein
VPYIERFLQDCLMQGAAMQVARKRGHCHGNALMLRVIEFMSHNEPCGITLTMGSVRCRRHQMSNC